MSMQEEIAYKGYRDELGLCHVARYDQNTLRGWPLDPRHDLYNHSPDGFEWGYGGSGPSQLALAILADATDDETALKHYQTFKRIAITDLPQHTPWIMPQKDVIMIVETMKGLFNP